VRPGGRDPLATIAEKYDSTHRVQSDDDLEEFVRDARLITARCGWVGGWVGRWVWVWAVCEGESERAHA